MDNFSLRSRDRRRFQFSLRRLLVFTLVVASLAAAAVEFPQFALIVAFVVGGICVLMACFAAMLAEGIFLDWLDSKLHSDDKTGDNSNDT